MEEPHEPLSSFIGEDADGDPCPLLLTDREIASQSLAEREEMAADVLEVIAKALDSADATLDGLEQNRQLGPAIKRVCGELADSIASVADEIGKQSEEDRRKFARACIEDARAELELLEGVVISSTSGGSSSSDSSETFYSGINADENADEIAIRQCQGQGHASAAHKVSSLTEQDMCNAVSSAQTILLDVESALRSIGQDEAEELAEVGITVARMFVWSLQNIQQSVTPQELAGTEEERNMKKKRKKRKGDRGRGEVDEDSGIQIEYLDEMEDEDDLFEDETSDIPDSNKTSRQDRRMRVLWPPLGPAVASVGNWGANTALKHPILTVALAMALWPAALVAAFIGAPIVAVDHALQMSYDTNKDSSVIEAAERGAANLYQVGKLYYLCTKLVVKQSLRVGGRQIERRGGLGAVACDIGGFALDRALHPIESATWAMNSVKWAGSTLLEAALLVKDVATGDATVVGGAPADMH